MWRRKSDLGESKKYSHRSAEALLGGHDFVLGIMSGSLTNLWPEFKEEDIRVMKQLSREWVRDGSARDGCP